MDTTAAPQIIEHIRQSVDFTVTDTKWIPGSARFAVSGVAPKGTGVVRIHQLEDGKANVVFSLDHAFKTGVKCMTFGHSRLDARQVALGDYTGRLSIYDLQQMSDSPIYSVQAHESIINCIDGVGGLPGRGAPEIVTGGKDGCVRVWDPRIDHAVVSLEPEKNQSPRDCWTVAFGNSYNDTERCVTAGYDNGDVKMYDLRTNKLRWEHNCLNGVTCVDFDRKDIEMNKMIVTSLESKFRLYDLRTQHSVDGFTHLSERAHKSTVWLTRHLPQNRDLFVTGGGNGGLNIYKYHYPSNRVGKHKQDNAPVGIVGTVELLNSRVLSTQPIISFDWSVDRQGLCCMACLDQSIR